jgi:hypothetical protein
MNSELTKSDPLSFLSTPASSMLSCEASRREESWQTKDS